MPLHEIDPELQELLRTGALMLTLLPPKWWEQGLEDDAAWPNHELVLRPLLEASSEAWVYSTRQGTLAQSAATGLLERVKGKDRIRRDVEPISGRESFWNACSGDRGSVVLLIPSSRFPAGTIFPHCWGPEVLGNFTAAHTPSAVRFARELASVRDQVVCMLSRNNGFQWLFILAAPEKLLALQALASRLCKTPPP